jgi:hypothetical protein
LFGYDASECLGKNIGFLQGAGTTNPFPLMERTMRISREDEPQ